MAFLIFFLFMCDSIRSLKRLDGQIHLRPYGLRQSNPPSPVWASADKEKTPVPGAPESKRSLSPNSASINKHFTRYNAVAGYNLSNIIAFFSGNSKSV